jgi:hypothetical protein
MKTGRIAISIMILLGLMAGFTVPVVHAQTGDEITFHVLNSSHLETIPDDAEGTITMEGTYNWGYYYPGQILEVTLQNICEGTGCTAQDIYYKIELATNWDNFLYFSCGAPNGYCGKNLAPWPIYTYGSSIHLISDIGNRCLGVYVPEVSPPGGSCTHEILGMIPASDISTDPNIGHEVFQLAIGSDYGAETGATDYQITFSTSPIFAAECSGQYLTGTALGSFVLSSKNQTGVNLQTVLGANYPAPGDWFIVQITSGSWQDDGIGPDLQTLGYKMGASTPAWYPLGSNPFVNCVADNTYYLQMSIGNGAAFLRVWDQGGNFIDNMGDLYITIYAVAAFTRYQSGCELQYEVGNFVEQKMVNADRSGGWPLAMPVQNHPVVSPTGGEVVTLPKYYYMLETIGGPANLGAGGYTWDADLGYRALATDLVPETWYEIQIAPFVECVVKTDLVGHVKVFFESDRAIDLYTFTVNFYSFRVRDPDLSYTDNSGSLSYRLYQAKNMQTSVPGIPPTLGGCQMYSHNATPTGSIVIQGNNISGTSLPVLTSGVMYALQVVDGPWLDNTTEKYAVQISDDDGYHWVDLEDYPNLLCASSPAVGAPVMIYLYAAPGLIFRARADDGDSNYSNNSGSVGMDIYASQNGATWPDCQTDYELTLYPLTDEQRTIPGNISSGKTVPWVTSGHLYSIEIAAETILGAVIGEGPRWYENGEGDGSYLVDISDDGGSTWQNLEGYTNLCAGQLDNSGGRFQIYFTAQSSNYRLRVRDGDGNFLTNTGYVFFNLYSGLDTTVPPLPGTPKPPWIDHGPPPEWVVACNEAYSRPDSVITWVSVTIPVVNYTISFPVARVGDWLEYVRAAITFYFAWCPQHTAALQAMGQVYLDREPMASIQVMMDFGKSIQTLLAAYKVSGGEAIAAGLVSQEPALFSDTQYIGVPGGEANYAKGAATGPWDLFMVGQLDPATNVWFGGHLDLAASLGTSDLSTMAAYQTLCEDKFYSLFGIATVSYCSLMSAMRFLKIVTWLLLGMDLLASVWFFLKYLPGYLRRFWNILSGNKTIVKQAISKL